MNSLTYSAQAIIVPQNALGDSNSDVRSSAQLENLIAETDEIPDLEEICADDRAFKSFVVKAIARIKKSRYLLFKEIYRLGRFIYSFKEKSSDKQFQKISLILREDAGVSNSEQKTALKLYEKIKKLPEAKRRQLSSIDKPIWNLTLFDKLCQLSEPRWTEFSCSLTKLKRQANFGYSTLKDLIESLLPPKYLKCGQPFKDIDRELIASKLELTPEALATIISKAQEIVANREDPTLLTDDIISSLAEAGYDTSIILPPPPKPTKREAEALIALEKAERERAEALSLVQQLELELFALRQQIYSPTSSQEIPYSTAKEAEPALHSSATSSELEDAQRISYSNTTRFGSDSLVNESVIASAEIQVEQISVVDSNKSADNLLGQTEINAECLAAEEIALDYFSLATNEEIVITPDNLDLLADVFFGVTKPIETEAEVQINVSSDSQETLLTSETELKVHLNSNPERGVELGNVQAPERVNSVGQDNTSFTDSDSMPLLLPSEEGESGEAAASLWETTNRDSSINMIDAQPSESLAESAIALATEPLSGGSNGDFTAAPVAPAVSTSPNYLPVVRYSRNAPVGIWNVTEQKIERWGKMIGHARQKILVSFSKGSPQWYEMSQLRIVEQQSDSNKSKRTKSRKGFRELIEQCS